jgi:hypothetical protein
MRTVEPNRSARCRGQAFPIVDIGCAERIAVSGLRNQKRVRAFAGLGNGVGRSGVKQQRSAVTDVYVDMAERSAKCGIRPNRSIDDVVRVPITPDYSSTAREYS